MKNLFIGIFIGVIISMGSILIYKKTVIDKRKSIPGGNYVIFKKSQLPKPKTVKLSEEVNHYVNPKDVETYMHNFKPGFVKSDTVGFQFSTLGLLDFMTYVQDNNNGEITDKMTTTFYLGYDTLAKKLNLLILPGNEKGWILRDGKKINAYDHGSICPDCVPFF